MGKKCDGWMIASHNFMHYPVFSVHLMFSFSIFGRMNGLSQFWWLIVVVRWGRSSELWQVLSYHDLTTNGGHMSSKTQKCADQFASQNLYIGSMDDWKLFMIFFLIFCQKFDDEPCPIWAVGEKLLRTRYQWLYTPSQTWLQQGYAPI